MLSLPFCICWWRILQTESKEELGGRGRRQRPSQDQEDAWQESSPPGRRIIHSLSIHPSLIIPQNQGSHPAHSCMSIQFLCWVWPASHTAGSQTGPCRKIIGHHQCPNWGNRRRNKNRNWNIYRSWEWEKKKKKSQIHLTRVFQPKLLTTHLDLAWGWTRKIKSKSKIQMSESKGLRPATISSVSRSSGVGELTEDMAPINSARL